MSKITKLGFEDPNFDCECDAYLCREVENGEREIFEQNGKFKGLSYATCTSCREDLQRTMNLPQ